MLGLSVQLPPCDLKRQPYLRLRHVFLFQQIWLKFFEANKASIRDVAVETMVKLFACCTHAMGFAGLVCPNSACNHTQNICFSCKSRYCGSCGAKATAQWMHEQINTLPTAPWAHITFTMPGEFWPLFEYNRKLLNQLSTLAAQSCLKICARRGLVPGIFSPIHTHSRALNWHVHIHLSITLGGLTPSGTWQSISFSKKSLMRAWRYRVIALLRKSFDTLRIPDSLEFEGQNPTHWNTFLDRHYKRHWNIDLRKPTRDPWQTFKYLGRYLKRPPASYSRILHYSDSAVVYRYLSHRSHRHETVTFSPDGFIREFIRHIHDKHFRVVRYYGFLANRVRKTMLHKVYEALQQTPKAATKITHASLLKRFVNVDPLNCILCGARMFFNDIQPGMSLAELKTHHHDLASMRPV